MPSKRLAPSTEPAFLRNLSDLSQKIQQAELHQADLRENPLPGQNFSREADYKPQHGESTIPVFRKVSKAKLFIAFH